MNLISSEAGQAIQLLPMDEVRPLRGGPFLPDLVTEIARRYRFVSFPQKFVAGQEIKFETGVVEHNGTTIPIRDLQIYNDGFIVTTSHTDNSDTVMNGFIEWAITAFQFRSPVTQVSRRYYSTIVVDFQGGLDRFMRNFDACRDIVSRLLGADAHIARMTFATDPTIPTVSSWQIEARVGSPIGGVRYFSAAPLATRMHVDMLAVLEQAVK